jgi:cell fate regulator YaaT (PSP1 superfamily)
MACSGCSTKENGKPGGCNNNGVCGTSGCNKLTVFDWLANMELPEHQKPFDVMEVRFKNSRKEYFRNVNNLQLFSGDVVAVEGTPGHDIGVVSLTGELVKLQLKKRHINLNSDEIKKIYRVAKQQDIDKWKEAQDLEKPAMYKARTLAQNLNLQMKISDVEYQGDKSKAIFYYTADDRVDFRELIKVMADEFKIRIEMRQIGARQEAGRLGGIGSCGRELCCSTWLTDFRTVSTSAARYQQLSLNPMKLAGQCGKLKCCLNFELDTYMDALKGIPEMDGKFLMTKKGKAVHEKTDIFKSTLVFKYLDEPSNFIAVKADRVKEILAMNEQNIFPFDLNEVGSSSSNKPKQKIVEFENVVGQDSLTRFDHKNKNQNKHSNKQRFVNKNKTGGSNQGNHRKGNSRNNNQGKRPTQPPK